MLNFMEVTCGAIDCVLMLLIMVVYKIKAQAEAVAAPLPPPPPGQPPQEVVLPKVCAGDLRRYTYRSCEARQTRPQLLQQYTQSILYSKHLNTYG